MQENNVFVKAPFIQSQSPLQKLSHETAGVKSDIPYANVVECLQERDIMEYMPYRDDLLIGRGVETEDMIIATKNLGLDNNHTLSKEEFMSCDNKVRNSYMAVIYKYSLLQPDNIVLQAVCDYAKANVTLACIGAHSDVKGWNG